MGLKRWKEAKKAVQQVFKSLKDPNVQKNFTSAYNKEFYEKNSQANLKKIEDIFENMDKVDQKIKEFYKRQDTTANYRRKKLMRFQNIAKDAINNLMLNQTKDYQLYSEEQKQEEEYDEILDIIEKRA